MYILANSKLQTNNIKYCKKLCKLEKNLVAHNATHSTESSQ